MASPDQDIGTVKACMQCIDPAIHLLIVILLVSLGYLKRFQRYSKTEPTQILLFFFSFFFAFVFFCFFLISVFIFIFLIGKFLSLVGLEPRTSHKPFPSLYHLSHASRALISVSYHDKQVS